VAIESTFVMIKPDGVRRGLVGEVISRFERKGLKLAQARLLTIDRALAERHYAEHIGKAFFEDLAAFITSGPVLAMEWSGDGAVEVARTLMGVTDPKKAAPGTIRGDFGLVVTENVVHGSDSAASAERELGLFFA
jgi:nucleoside-diphosphate kinase